MKTGLIIVGACAAIASSNAMAGLYWQSFEDESMLGAKYFDLLDAGTDHALVNNPGEAHVNGPGFNAWYFTTGGVGLTDGDFVGVTDYLGDTGGMYDGDNAYQMSDTDGIMTLIFDDYGSNVNVSLAIFIADTGYESADTLSISYGSDVIMSIEDTGDGGLAMEGVSGIWIELVALDVSGNLTISWETNSASETLYIDAVSIYIPAPGALALLGIAGLARRRRR